MEVFKYKKFLNFWEYINFGKQAQTKKIKFKN